MTGVQTCALPIFYFWVDGIYLQARMESEKNCILVIIGVDEYGKKELVAIDDGFRESKESWQGLLLDIKSRGLIHSPALAVGDGALGFWGALTEEYPTTVHQRCWVHKTSNILNKLPKSQQAKAKCHCQLKRDHLFAPKRDHLSQKFLAHGNLTFLILSPITWSGNFNHFSMMS